MSERFIENSASGSDSGRVAQLPLTASGAAPQPSPATFTNSGIGVGTVGAIVLVKGDRHHGINQYGFAKSPAANATIFVQAPLVQGQALTIPQLEALGTTVSYSEAASEENRAPVKSGGRAAPIQQNVPLGPGSYLSSIAGEAAVFPQPGPFTSLPLEPQGIKGERRVHEPGSVFLLPPLQNRETLNSREQEQIEGSRSGDDLGFMERIPSLQQGFFEKSIVPFIPGAWSTTTASFPGLRRIDHGQTILEPREAAAPLQSYKFFPSPASPQPAVSPETVNSLELKNLGVFPPLFDPELNERVRSYLALCQQNGPDVSGVISKRSEFPQTGEWPWLKSSGFDISLPEPGKTDEKEGDPNRRRIAASPPSIIDHSQPKQARFWSEQMPALPRSLNGTSEKPMGTSLIAPPVVSGPTPFELGNLPPIGSPVFSVNDPTKIYSYAWWVQDERMESEMPPPSMIPRLDKEQRDPQAGTSENSCVVCGRPAQGKFYGVLCCYGCKNFFRRSPATRRFSNQCQNRKSCIINGETRNDCMPCRYQKCIDKGMRFPPKNDYEETKSVSITPVQLPGTSVFTAGTSRPGEKRITMVDFGVAYGQWLKAYEHRMRDLSACFNDSDRKVLRDETAPPTFILEMLIRSRGNNHLALNKDLRYLPVLGVLPAKDPVSAFFEPLIPLLAQLELFKHTQNEYGILVMMFHLNIRPSLVQNRAQLASRQQSYKAYVEIQRAKMADSRYLELQYILLPIVAASNKLRILARIWQSNKGLLR